MADSLSHPHSSVIGGQYHPVLPVTDRNLFGSQDYPHGADQPRWITAADPVFGGRRLEESRSLSPWPQTGLTIFSQGPGRGSC